MFELLLISVVLTNGYLGTMILRSFGAHQRVYGMMIIADAVLALLSILSRASDGPNATADTVGAISIGAGFCLVILPPMLRDLGRRLMAGQRLRLAKALAELRELLQPGMGARQEAELIETVLAVRLEREDEIIEALEARKAESEDPAFRAAMDERIIMILLFAQRWGDAVKRYDRAVSMGRRPGSPQLTVEMVRACCEAGEIDSAADLVGRIEDSPLVEEMALRTLFARGRLVFLAFMGRTGAVESMMSKGGDLAQMQEASRYYWLGISRMHAGDLVGARSDLKEAIERSAGDLNAAKAAQKQLDRLSGDEPLRRNPPLASSSELADKITALVTQKNGTSGIDSGAPGKRGRSLPSMRGIPLKRMPVTTGFAVVNIVASLAVYLSFGGITDLGALVLSGANLKFSTAAGEWWRIGSSMFLHGGMAHLFLNVYGLWVLGRLVEQLHGSLRMASIYLLSGVTAGIASTFLGGMTTSVGASGAVLGLMGAALVELALYRKNYPPQWSRPLFRLLLLISVAQIAIGFFYPIVDQWGHIGGLVGGLVIGVLLSPHAIFGKTLNSAIAALFFSASVLFAVYSAYGVARSDYGQNLRSQGVVAYDDKGLAISVPAAWEKIGDHEFVDSGIAAQFDLRIVTADEGLDAVISSRLEQERQEGELQDGYEISKVSAQSHMPLPVPWRGGELEVRIDDGSGVQHYRLLVFGRVVGNTIWLGSYAYPAALSDSMNASFSQVLSSIHMSR